MTTRIRNRLWVAAGILGIALCVLVGVQWSMFKYGMCMDAGFSKATCLFFSVVR